LGDERDSFPGSQECVAPDVIAKDNRKIIVPEKFREDIEALEKYMKICFKSGLCIKISLAEIYSIVPRRRRRIDSYKGLVRYIEEELNVKLVINSNKTKSL